MECSSFSPVKNAFEMNGIQSKQSARLNVYDRIVDECFLQPKQRFLNLDRIWTGPAFQIPNRMNFTIMLLICVCRSYIVYLKRVGRTDCGPRTGFLDFISKDSYALSSDSKQKRYKS